MHIVINIFVLSLMLNLFIILYKVNFTVMFYFFKTVFSKRQPKKNPNKRNKLVTQCPHYPREYFKFIFNRINLVYFILLNLIVPLCLCL